MKRFWAVSLIAVGSMVALAMPTASEARGKASCEPKPVYIVSVKHGDYSDNADMLLVLDYIVEGESKDIKRATTERTQDLRGHAAARSLASFALTAMLAKSRVNLIHEDCKAWNGWGRMTLWGIEVLGQ